MNHDELIQIGKRLLKNRYGCGVVVSELVTQAGETPDVFGMRDGGAHTYLIECKTSRSDFLADQKKPWRKPGAGLGLYRFYMAPAGLIAVEELPKAWGLIEVNEKGKAKRIVGKDHYKNCYAEPEFQHERNISREMTLLYSLLRRIATGQDIGKYFEQAV